MNDLPMFFEKLYARLRRRLKREQDRETLREAALALIEEPSPDEGEPPAEREILTNVISLRDKDVADCMVPRADIVAADIESSLSDIVALMISCAHSRLPVYRETLDETVGMVHTKDVLPYLAEGKDCALRDILRPVLFAAPSMSVSKLLFQMRESRQHMAMVIDEFGGVDGLVTIEDLVEEIVGDIKDEHHDEKTPDVIFCSDGSLLADGGIDVAAFEERVGLTLGGQEREAVDTLGGYVFDLAGRALKVGETIEGPGGLFFDVLAVEQSRIRRLRVRGIRRENQKNS